MTISPSRALTLLQSLPMGSSLLEALLEAAYRSRGVHSSCGVHSFCTPLCPHETSMKEDCICLLLYP